MTETLINITLNGDANKPEEDKSSCLIASQTIESNNDEPAEQTSSAIEVKYDLSEFRLQRILNNNTRNKSIALLGDFPKISEIDKAIVLFEKHAFQESDVTTTAGVHNDNICDKNGSKDLEEKSLMKPSYFCSELKVHTDFINNIYGSYQCIPPPELSGIKATVVYPATDKHIEKYSICQRYVITETPELYDKITLPYITSSQFSLEWVYNILEHKQETDRIIFEDPDPDNGFIILPDLKWDGKNVENLYTLAITHKRDIKSLRDLNASHLPLLRSIRTHAAKCLESRYGILSTQLRMYIHYQPSFYHLHVHINPVQNDAPGIWCEKSHMLDTVINNLELLPDYYKKATLPFVLYKGNKLLELYEDKKAIKRNAALDDEGGDIKAAKQKIVEIESGKTGDITN